MRKNVYTDTIWEKQAAYCRATRFKDMIFVAGTTAIDENGLVVGKEDMYQQTIYIFNKIEDALKKVDANLSHVMRTRMFTTDISRCAEIIKAHGEVFSGIDPVSTCVEVKSLVHPDLLVEIEVDAMM